jgi:hypothetical protein
VLWLVQSTIHKTNGGDLMHYRHGIPEVVRRENRILLFVASRSVDHTPTTLSDVYEACGNNTLTQEALKNLRWNDSGKNELSYSGKNGKAVLQLTEVGFSRLKMQMGEDFYPSPWTPMLAMGIA